MHQPLRLWRSNDERSVWEKRLRENGLSTSDKKDKKRCCPKFSFLVLPAWCALWRDKNGVFYVEPKWYPCGSLWWRHPCKRLSFLTWYVMFDQFLWSCYIDVIALCLYSQVVAQLCPPFLYLRSAIPSISVKRFYCVTKRNELIPILIFIDTMIQFRTKPIAQCFRMAFVFRSINAAAMRVVIKFIMDVWWQRKYLIFLSRLEIECQRYMSDAKSSKAVWEAVG